MTQPPAVLILKMLGLLLVSALIAFAGRLAPPAGAEAALLPIGAIQGAGDVSPYLDQVVSFRGVVTGLYASRNTSGITYFTLFVQDPVGTEDGNPATSDGMAIFHGRRRPDVALGDLLRVTGQVTEFYGLTEIAERGLDIQLESRNQPLPEPIPLNPPAANEALAAYYEPLEGMRVTVPGTAVVVGPTYGGCGFAVSRADSGVNRILRHRDADPIGLAVLILHTTNVSCAGFPHVASGDQVEGLVGPLIYHFDQYKLIHQEPAALNVTAVARPTLPPPPTPDEGQITVATFNLENYFDLVNDTGAGAETEPVPTAAELAIKRAKLAYAIGRLLGCPTLIGVQEVEKASLLRELAAETAAHCAFTYQVTHLESADIRGIDVALLSDPRRVDVVAARLHQSCTTLATGIHDPTLQCPGGQQPLSSRPPLQIDVRVDGRPLSLFVNHFKSKRGGEAESAPQREAQAELITAIVQAMLASDPETAVIVMGDFNDYFDSAPLRRMTGGARPLQNVLAQLPEGERYSFIFGGASQLIDGLLLSPALMARLAGVTIVHNSADFPFSLATDISPENLAYRTSDHDIPLLLLQWSGERPLPAGAPETGANQPPAVPWLWLILALIGGMVVGAIGITAVMWRQNR
jgi:uncharacterized protein